MKNIRLLFICLFLPSIFWRCDQLGYSEASDYTQDYIFNDAYLNGTVLVDIYSYLPADFNSIDGATRSCASDDAEYVWDLSSVQKFND